jgi:predicted nucleotidyltransferase
MNTPEQVDPLAQRALDRFKSILTERYGSHLRGMYLFGSRARGDHRPDSDADVAVVLDVAVDPLGEQLALIDLGYDILLDTGVYIQPWVLAQDQLHDPPNRHLDGLLGAIRCEGVAL